VVVVTSEVLFADRPEFPEGVLVLTCRVKIEPGLVMLFPLGRMGLGGGGLLPKPLMGDSLGVESRVEGVGEILLLGEPVLLIVEGAPPVMLVPGEPVSLLPLEEEDDLWRDETRCRVPLLKIGFNYFL